jgi:hypothetical protein
MSLPLGPLPSLEEVGRERAEERKNKKSETVWSRSFFYRDMVLYT